MGKRTVLVVGTLCLVALPGVARLFGQGREGEGAGGPMGPRRPMGPPPPPITMTIANGVVYLLQEGQLTAFEGKTLKKLAEAFLPQPKRPERGQTGPDNRAPEPPQAMEERGGPMGPDRRMGPPMPPPPASLAVADHHVYVLVGPTLYQYDAKSLKELNHVDLKVPKPPVGPEDREER